MRPQPSTARCIEARSVRSPSTTSAPSRRGASARSSSRRTKARTLCPLASRNSARLRPMPPTAPAAPVTRIRLSCLCFVVMSRTLGYVQKTNWRRGARAESYPSQSRRSGGSDIEDRLRKGLRGFLRQIVSHPTVNGSVFVLAGEFLGVSTGLRVWRAIGITLERNRGHSDVGTCGKAGFQFVIFGLAFGQAKPPSIVVNDNAYMIGIVQRGCTPHKCSLLEVPFR